MLRSAGPQSRFARPFEYEICSRTAPNATNSGRNCGPIRSAESSSSSDLAGSDYLIEPMTFFKKLMSGQIALWCVFWLIGSPLTVLWYLGGVCTVVGCGIQDTTVAAILLALFALSSIAIPLASVGLWRSASKYPRQTWSQTLLATGAKLCAVVSSLLAVIGLAVLLYIGFYIFINPLLDHA